MICLEMVGGFLMSLSKKPRALNHGADVFHSKVFPSPGTRPVHFSEQCHDLVAIRLFTPGFLALSEVRPQNKY